jgi:hypothetical protein
LKLLPWIFNLRCFMLERGRVARSFVWLLLLVSTFALSQSGGKKKVTSQADLPRFSYPLTGTASELVQSDDATFNAFARKVRADLDGVLRDYEIDDKATLRTLLSVKLDLEELAGEYKEGLQTVEALRALQQKPRSQAFRLPVHACQVASRHRREGDTGSCLRAGIHEVF